AGKNWQRLAPLMDRPRRIWVDPHSDSNDRTLFIWGDHSFTVATGKHTRSASIPSVPNEVSMGFGSGAQSVLYASTEQGILISTDGAQNWHKSELPGQGAKVRAIATSLQHPETAYVSYDHLASDGKTWIGVAKTTNSGESWQLVWKEAESAAKNV